MRILAVDTALGACSAAVVEDELTRAHCLEWMERGHAERLASMVRETMAQSGVEFAELDRLAVTVGPGTFTGQRVGYAFMRGLRLALKKPLIGVTTLAAMAKAAMAETRARGAAVLHDAKRAEVYAYAEVDGTALLPIQLTSFDEAIRRIADISEFGDTLLACGGTAARIAADRLHARGRKLIETNILNPDALWVARIARGEPEPGALPRPLYLRPPDARLPEVFCPSPGSKIGRN